MTDLKMPIAITMFEKQIPQDTFELSQIQYHTHQIKARKINRYIISVWIWIKKKGPL